MLSIDFTKRRLFSTLKSHSIAFQFILVYFFHTLIALLFQVFTHSFYFLYCWEFAEKFGNSFEWCWSISADTRVYTAWIFWSIRNSIKPLFCDIKLWIKVEKGAIEVQNNKKIKSLFNTWREVTINNHGYRSCFRRVDVDPWWVISVKILKKILF